MYRLGASGPRFLSSRGLQLSRNWLKVGQSLAALCRSPGAVIQPQLTINPVTELIERRWLRSAPIGLDRQPRRRRTDRCDALVLDDRLLDAGDCLGHLGRSVSLMKDN